MLRSPSFLALSSLVGACGPAAPDDTAPVPCIDCACVVPAVEIGEGATTHASAVPDSPATMVHGPQGGWHVLTSVGLDGLGPLAGLHLTIDADLPAHEAPVRVSDNTYRVLLTADRPCGGSYAGMYAYLDVGELADGERDTPPELLEGVPLYVTVVAQDDNGRTATGALRRRAALDPRDAGGSAAPGTGR